MEILGFLLGWEIYDQHPNEHYIDDQSTDQLTTGQSQTTTGSVLSTPSLEGSSSTGKKVPIENIRLLVAILPLLSLLVGKVAHAHGSVSPSDPFASFSFPSSASSSSAAESTPVESADPSPSTVESPVQTNRPAPSSAASGDAETPEVEMHAPDVATADSHSPNRHPVDADHLVAEDDAIADSPTGESLVEEESIADEESVADKESVADETAINDSAVNDSAIAETVTSDESPNLDEPDAAAAAIADAPEPTELEQSAPEQSVFEHTELELSESVFDMFDYLGIPPDSDDVPASESLGDGAGLEPESTRPLDARVWLESLTAEPDPEANVERDSSTSTRRGFTESEDDENADFRWLATPISILLPPYLTHGDLAEHSPLDDWEEELVEQLVSGDAEVVATAASADSTSADSPRIVSDLGERTVPRPQSVLLPPLSYDNREEILLAQAITPANDSTGTNVRQQGNRFDIDGGSRSGDRSNLFHSFQRFGLSQDQIANFISNPEIRNILGRVVGGDVSNIDGLIQVTGGNSNLFLINPAGLIFGPNASLNVPGDFTATTANGVAFGDEWFNAVGDTLYSSLNGDPTGFAFGMSTPGSIINAGNLAVEDGQNLTLMGGTVTNTGTLSAPEGEITVTAVPGGSRVRLSQDGVLLTLEIEPLGSDQPNALPYSPNPLPELLTGGHTELATGVTVNPDGTVMLVGADTQLPSDTRTAIASGTLDTSGNMGGSVNVLGDRVAVTNATINASGDLGGGTVRIGGDYQGGDSLPAATNTLIDDDVQISADALLEGDGGLVVGWADRTTGFYGDISARGGAIAGDGGFVEVSGAENLLFEGLVNVTATNGQAGTLLLDPINITISNAPDTVGVVAALPDIFSPDFAGDDITINATTLENQAGNVVLEATNNISILDGVSLNFGFGESITFTADANSDGVGSFSMDTAQSIIARGNATENGRNITISGAQVTVGNIDTGIDAVGSTTNSGNIQISSSNGNITTGTLTTTIGNGNGNAGSIDLNAISGNITNVSSTAFGANGSGGAVTFATTDGNITTGNIDSGSSTTVAGSQGGDITLRVTGTGNISAGLLQSWGFNQGPGGEVILATANGNIQSSGIESYSRTGVDGNILLEAGGIDSSIEIIGTLNTRDSISTPGTDQIGTGNITLTSNEINLSGGADSVISVGQLQIQPFTPTSAIAIGGTADSGTGTLDLQTRDLSTLQDGFSSITIGRADSSGTITLSGDVSFTDPSTVRSPVGAGSINTTGGTLTTNGNAIALSASADIATGDIDSSSTSGDGGTITITSTNGAIDTTAGNVTSTSGGFNSDSGDITLIAENSIITGNIDSSLSDGYIYGTNQAGDITITSNSSTIDTSAGRITANAADGDGGAVRLRANDTITTGDIDTSLNTSSSFSPTASRRGGDIIITSDAGAIDTTQGTLNTRGDISSDTSGNVELSADSDITTASITGIINITSGGTIDTRVGQLGSSTADSGGTISLRARGNVFTGDMSTIVPIGETDGDITITSTGGEIDTTSGQIISSSFDTAGDITLTADGNITTGDITSNAFTDRPDATSGAIAITSVSGTINTTQGRLDASGFNASGGNITLRAEGDITTSEISASRSGYTFDGSSGNITLTSNTGAIDTTQGPLNASGDGDATTSGNVELSADGDITTASIATGSSNNASAGTITLMSGGNVDTSAGQLNSSTGGDGGAIALNASGNITTGRIDASSDSGTSGDITLTSTTGAIDTREGSLSAFSSEGAGGNVRLSARDDITTSSIFAYGNPGGTITITSNAGSIDTTSGSLSASGRSTGNGGAISLMGESIATDFLFAGSDGGNGGTITLTGRTGTIDTQSGRLDTSASSFSGGRNGGDITIRSEGNVLTGSINASGSNGDGGNVRITSTSGSIDTLARTIDTSPRTILTGSSTGDGGTIELNAQGDVVTGFLSSNAFTSSDGNGGNGENRRSGNITITSTTGTIDTTEGDLSAGTRADLADGGNIRLEAEGTITTASIITGSTDGNGGNITLTSRSGGISTTQGRTVTYGEYSSPTYRNALLDSSAMGGNGGNIRLRADGDITTREINSSSDANSGRITITSNSGAIDSQVSISSQSTGGNGGAIALSAPENVTVRAIDASGTNTTGDINITSNEIDIQGAIASNGDLTLQPFDPDQPIILSGESATPRNLDLTRDELSFLQEGFRNIFIGRSGVNRITYNRSTFNDPVRLQAGSVVLFGGLTSSENNIDFSEAGTVNTRLNGTIQTDESLRFIGTIRLQSDTTITATGNSDIIFEGPVGGNFRLDIDADDNRVTFDSQDNNASTIRLRDVRINSDETLIANRLVVSDSVDIAGNLTLFNNASISAGDQIQVDNITSDGSANLKADGDITVRDVTSLMTILLESGTKVSSRDLAANDTISVRAAESISTRDITSFEGDIALRGADDISSGDLFAGGTVIVQAIESITTGGITTRGGDVSLDPEGDIEVVYIQSNGGDIEIETERYFRATGFIPETDSSIDAGQGTIRIRHGGGLRQEPFSVGFREDLTNGTVGAIRTDQGAITRRVLRSFFDENNIRIITDFFDDDPTRTLEEPEQPARPADELEPPAPEIPIVSIAVGGAEESIVTLEDAYTSQFEQYFGIPREVAIQNVEGAKATLRSVTEATGVQPAIVYVTFAQTSAIAPTDLDQLELILVTAEGDSIRAQVPGATRGRVMDLARTFGDAITNPIRRRDPITLREPSRDLYEILIQPLKDELERQEIDNIAFIQDTGLRSLPMAALYDAQSDQFLIEQFSLGLMPSLSLTDTRYFDLTDAALLAMGASEFEELGALPTVPAELEAITQQWERDERTDILSLDILQARRDDDPFGIVHLATHASFQEGRPANSFIEFQDQRLTLEEIRDIGLNDPAVELLVLSACRTALTDEEAELGFAGSALQARVKTVLASLWSVSDTGASGLMAEFYRQLSQAPIRAEALQQAQIAMLNGDVRLEDGQLQWTGGAIDLSTVLSEDLLTQISTLEGEDLSHPYYWSAFTLVGSPW